MHSVSHEHAFLQLCVVLGPGGAQSCSFVMKTNIARVGSKELEPHVQVVLGFQDLGGGNELFLLCTYVRLQSVWRSLEVDLRTLAAFQNANP